MHTEGIWKVLIYSNSNNVGENMQGEMNAEGETF